MKRYLFSLLLIAAAGGCNRNAVPSETAMDARDNDSQVHATNEGTAAGSESMADHDHAEMAAPEHRTTDELATSGAVPDNTRSPNAASTAPTGGLAPTDTTTSANTTGTTPANTGVANTTDTTNTTGTDRDNTRVNARDRNDATLTPMDQSEKDSDVKITQEIRRALVDSDALSFNSKNVKVITRNGKVTLRGTVPNARERSLIEDAAKGRAGVSSVDNQIEVSNK